MSVNIKIHLYVYMERERESERERERDFFLSKAEQCLNFWQICLSQVTDAEKLFYIKMDQLVCECVFRLTTADNTPGTEFKPQGGFGVNFTPWQILMDVVATHKQTVRPLPVVWRTQLSFLRVVKDLCVLFNKFFYEGSYNQI